MENHAARLNPGETAPNFTLKNSQGEPVSLRDFRGKKVVLYFYPEAGTPGCTTQACDFRDNLNSLMSAGYQVIGISKDSSADLSSFASEYALNFPLLADEDLAVHHSYGTYGEKNLYGKKVTGVLRSTFVLDEEGVIVLALYNVKATGHVTALRKKLGIDG